MTKFDKERQQLAINYWKRVRAGANHYHKLIPEAQERVSDVVCPNKKPYIILVYIEPQCDV